MSRMTSTLALLAAMSAGVALAQETDMSGAQSPAPIERNYEHNYGGPGGAPAVPPADPADGAPAPHRPPVTPQMRFVSVAPGIWLRSAPDTVSRTVSASPDKVEIRIDHGVANLNVHHPDHRPEILVDLPGGQTAVLKDGLYTFNAESNTVRTLKGEAEVFPGNAPNTKPVKVKEEHALTFAGGELKAYEFGPMELRGDLLPGAGPAHGEPEYSGYGAGFYPSYYGGWGDPYWAYGSYWGGPYWGGPYWGYPGFGIGFGYVGGFGGFRHH